MINGTHKTKGNPTLSTAALTLTLTCACTLAL
jgi:hypothetical protein